MLPYMRFSETTVGVEGLKPMSVQCVSFITLDLMHLKLHEAKPFLGTQHPAFPFRN